MRVNDGSINLDTIVDALDEDRRRAFEAAWRDGRPRPIEEFLPPIGDGRRASTLEELVQIELEFAWKRKRNELAESPQGSPVGPVVEDYLSRFTLLNEPPALLRLLRQEYRVRQRHGDRPSVQDYCQRFPSLLPTPQQATPLLCPSGEDRPSSAPLRPGQGIGRYRLIEKQGQGGFGEVWRASDPELGRDVALKRLHPSLSARADYLARFAAEAKTTAGLEHPGVVPVHEFGFADDGTPFYTMRLFGGQTLAEAIRRAHDPKAPPSARSISRVQLLGTFLNVLRAVEFAHDRRTIHRDLTPRNILLGDYGETVILDWGLARGPRPDLGDSLAPDPPAQGSAPPGLTDPGTVMGTPPYMAPEQAAGRNDLVDARSDLHALGVILLEVLTGDPVADPKVSQSAPASLLAICRKAKARNQVDRYPTASAFRDDLEHALAFEPVSAYDEPWTARLVRWAKRRQRLVTTAAVALAAGLLVLAAMLVVVLDVNRRLNQATRDAVVGGRRADAQRIRAETALEKTRATLDRNLILQAHGELANNNPARARALLEACRPSGRDWEWNLAQRLCPRRDPLTLTGHRGMVRRVAYSPDGQRIAAVGSDGRLLVWDAANGQECWRSELAGAGRGLAYSPDGRRLVSSSRSKQAPIRFWDASSGALIDQWDTEGGDVLDLSYSRDGRFLATAAVDGKILLRDAPTGEVRQRFQGHKGAVLGVAFSPDGRLIASCGVDDQTLLWSTETGQQLRSDKGHGQNVNGLAFSPDGLTLATAGADRAVRLRSVTTWTRERSMERHAREVMGVAFSPDGRWLASVGMDRALRIWDPVNGRESIAPLGHEGHVLQLAVSPDGSAIATGGSDWTVKVWKLADLPRTRNLPGTMIALHPDGKHLATAEYGDKTPGITLWRIDTGETVRVLEDHPVGMLCLAFNPDGQVLASGHFDGSVGLWDFKSGRLMTLLQRHETAVYALAFRPGGLEIATGAVDGAIRLWNLRTGSHRALPGHKDLVSSLAFSPEGNLLASSSKDLTAKVWDLDQGQVVRVLEGHEQPLTHLAYSHDGRRIATTSIDGEFIVWDAANGSKVFSTRLGVIDLNTVAFSPDDRRIATGSEELLCLWDAEHGTKLCTLPGYECILDLGFTRDGKTLVVAGRHLGVRILSGEPSP